MKLFGKKKETKSCCCGGNCTSETMQNAENVNTDELVHTARSSSACFPVFQCTLSAA